MVSTRIARARGFTLIELVIVIVAIGILSATAMIGIGARAQHSVTAQADQFRRALSHLQLLAISQGGRLQLKVEAGSYTVCDAAKLTCAWATKDDDALADPATGEKFSIRLDDGAQFTTIPGTGTYYFDSLGRPVQASTGAALVVGPTTFKLNGVGRTPAVTVTVLPITGFAQTTYN